VFYKPDFEEDTVQENPTSNDLQKDLDNNLEKDMEKFRKFQLTDSQLKILAEMIENPKVTQKKLATIVGINDKNIRNNIQVLKKKGLVERVGPDKGGNWKVLI
jgi:ATP-dependent DNA helicase RecG